MPRHRNRHRSRQYAVHGNSPWLKRFHKPKPSTSSAPIFLRKSYIDCIDRTREVVSLIQQSIRVLPVSKGNKKPRSKISLMLPKVEEGDEEVEIIFDLSDLDLKLGKGGRQKQALFDVAGSGGGPEYVDVDRGGESGDSMIEMDYSQECMDWERTYTRVGIMIPKISEQIHTHYYGEGRMHSEDGDDYGLSVDGMDWEDEG